MPKIAMFWNYCFIYCLVWFGKVSKYWFEITLIFLVDIRLIKPNFKRGGRVHDNKCVSFERTALFKNLSSNSVCKIFQPENAGDSTKATVYRRSLDIVYIRSLDTVAWPFRVHTTIVFFHLVSADVIQTLTFTLKSFS